MDEEEKEAGTGNEGKRVKTAIENEREEEEGGEVVCLLQTQRGGLGQPRKASDSGSHRYNASIKHSLPK